MTTNHPAEKKREKHKLHKPNEKHNMHGTQGSPIRTDRAVAAYVVDSLDPDPPKGVAAFVKRFWALWRWRRTDECRAALDDWTAERPALAPAYEEATRFFIEMCPWGMRMLFGASRSTEEGVLRAVFFMSEMLLGSGTRHLSPGRLSYRGELTLEAYRRAGEALASSGAFSRAFVDKSFSRLCARIGCRAPEDSEADEFGTVRQRQGRKERQAQSERADAAAGPADPIRTER